MATPKKQANKKPSAKKTPKTPSTAKVKTPDVLAHLEQLLAPSRQLEEARKRLSVEDLILSIDITLTRGSVSEEDTDANDVLARIQNQVTISNALEIGAIAAAPGKVEQVIHSSILEPCLAKVFSVCNEMQDKARKDAPDDDLEASAFGLPMNDETYVDPDEDKAHVDEDDDIVDEEVDE